MVLGGAKKLVKDVNCQISANVLNFDPMPSVPGPSHKAQHKSVSSVPQQVADGKLPSATAPSNGAGSWSKVDS